MTDIIKKEGAESGDFRSDNHFLLGYFEEKDGALIYLFYSLTAPAVNPPTIYF